jgi:hypothetical protein
MFCKVVSVIFVVVVDFAAAAAVDDDDDDYDEYEVTTNYCSMNSIDKTASTKKEL